MLTKLTKINKIFYGLRTFELPSILNHGVVHFKINNKWKF